MYNNLHSGRSSNTCSYHNKYLHKKHPLKTHKQPLQGLMEPPTNHDENEVFCSKEERHYTDKESLLLAVPKSINKNLVVLDGDGTHCAV